MNTNDPRPDIRRERFLTDRNRIYAEDRKYLADYLSREGILFEGRPMPFEILPYMIPALADAEAREKFTRFHALLEKTIDLYSRHVDIRDYFNFNKTVEDLISSPCPYSPRIHLCRFDYTFGPDGGPVIYETNSACPGGLLLMRKIFAGYRKTGLYQDLSKLQGVKVSGYDYFTEPVFSRSLGRLYSAAKNVPANKPVVAILTSRSKTLTNEVGLMVEELSAAGYEALNVFVEELEYTGGKLLGRGRQIDLCYQKFDDHIGCEYPFTPESVPARDYARALREGAAMGVNSFASTYLIESKMTLALFWEKDFEHHFTREELNFARALTTRTEVLCRQDDNAVRRFKAEKDFLVLKRSLDTRGRSVLIGLHTPQAVWDKAVEDSRGETSFPYVLQRYCGHEKYTDAGGTLQYISHAYFVLGGEAIGMFTRHSSSPVTNVGRCGMLGIPFKFN